MNKYIVQLGNVLVQFTVFRPVLNVKNPFSMIFKVVCEKTGIVSTVNNVLNDLVSH